MLRTRSVLFYLTAPKEAPMKFASIRMITDDLDRILDFYERVTGVEPTRYNPVFGELRFPNFTLAVGHSDTTRLFGEDSAAAGQNRSIIVEFLVDDVEAEYERLQEFVEEWVQEPTTMPWGNRSILFRDPDGNLVNLFTPVTDEAIAKFAD
jgi:catechol 2,3-dioxygenase-like lactoylglutathione lyase family enzyme